MKYRKSSKFCKCGNERRPGQRTCRDCHAKDIRERRAAAKFSLTAQQPAPVWKPGAILTASGRMICPLDADPALIVVEDIAHALAHINRFTGHTCRPYSVAEHCVRGLAFVPQEHRLAWLMHDATEAYLGDVASPLKRSFTFMPYRNAESNLWAQIAAKFGIAVVLPAIVKEIDLRMLATEMRDLMLMRPPEALLLLKPAEPLRRVIPATCGIDWKAQFLKAFAMYSSRKDVAA